MQSYADQVLAEFDPQLIAENDKLRRELAATQQLHREEREKAQRWLREKDEALAAERERVRGVLNEHYDDLNCRWGIEKIATRLGIDLDK